jgi:small GTP-binding protein
MPYRGCVGKTSLIKRFILDVFDDKYLKTLGTKVSKKVVIIKIPEKDLRISLTLLIWDIMGQETFLSILENSYFFGINGGLAVCDSTRGETLEELERWVESLYKVAGKVPLVFIANKKDLSDNLQIDEETLTKFAAKYNSTFLYTSAKTGKNVEKAFQELGKLVTSDIS